MAVTKQVEGGGTAVVMVPLPAQGHLNQLLHLSRLIAARGVPVHYAASATHNRQARERLHGWDLSSAAANGNIRFHDLPIPPFTTPPPDPHSPVTFPAHLQPLFDASLGLHQPLSSLLRSLSAAHRRLAVVHDSALSFVGPVAHSIPNAEAYAFHSVSAFNTLFYLREAQGNQLQLQQQYGVDFSFDGCFSDDFLRFLCRQHKMRDVGSGHLINSCHAIEGRFIEQISREPGWLDRKTFTIGPLNPVALKSSGPRHECLDWLDKQPPASVLYVSFGTITSLPDKQIAELAAGLEESKQRFIWVLRDADRGDIYANPAAAARTQQLPLHYDKRIEGYGMVVRGWAPQLEILAHGSTGGFLSHCGWNSCMESMTMGVPMLTWPMHSDQPANSVLVTKVLRVAVVARDWSVRREVFPASEIAGAILRLMVDERGVETRRRAEAVGHSVRTAMSVGGASMTELEQFLGHITAT